MLLEEEHFMADIAFVAVVLAFFVATWGLVALAEQLMKERP